MPSDAKKITLLVKAALAGAFSGEVTGAASAPAGTINKEAINRTETKRSRGIGYDTLFRPKIVDLCIIILSSGKFDVRLNCKHGQLRSRLSSLN
jgi:hypothetical protein